MDRAECNEIPPDLKQPKEVLEHLFKIEMERLKTAVRIEKERNIVFPETSVIIHDIRNIMSAYNGKPKKLLPSEEARDFIDSNLFEDI